MITFIIIFLVSMCIFDLYINKKIYSPTFVFNLIWLVTLSLYELKLSKLQHVLSERTVYIFLICILSYNITMLILKFFKLKKIKLFKWNKIINNSKALTIEQKIKIAKWICIVIFMIQVVYSKGVPLVWKFFGNSKNYFDFGIPSLNGAFCGLIICLGAYSFFTKSKDKYIYIAMGVLMISRQILMSIVIEAIIFAICDKSKKIDYKKYLIIIIILFVGFSVLGNFRSGESEIDKVFHAKEEYEELPTVVKWVYSYMTFSITNFDNLANLTDGGVNNGASLLSELLPTVLSKVINIKVNYSPYYLELSNFNVSTYLPSTYLDFGVWGVALLNIAIAILGKYLYVEVTTTNNIRSRLLYAVFIHNIIFIFFINMFLYLPILVQFIYIPIIFSQKSKVLEEKNKDENNSNVFTSIS